MTALSRSRPERSLVAVALAAGPRLRDALDRALDGGPALLPLAPDLPAPALERLLSTLRPSALVDARGTTPLADGLPVPEDVALVVATSGSTGTPKGVALTAAAVDASARAGLARLGGDCRDPGRWLACLPAHHVGGLLVLVRGRLTGVEPVVHPRFDTAAVAAAAADGEADHVALVPTMLARLLDVEAPLGRFRTVLLGGAAAPSALLARARTAGARVVTTYGMTETAGGCVWDGRPLDGVAAAIAGDGRIRLRGPVLCAGYREGSAVRPVVDGDGWLETADLGRWDADGRLVVLGRADDVIVTGGENVVASEVAALLLEHPAVADAAVVGRPDPEWGERVVAVVVPRGPAEPPSPEQLRAHVAERAGRAAAPRQVEFVAALPLLPGGKVDRLALRAPAT